MEMEDILFIHLPSIHRWILIHSSYEWRRLVGIVGIIKEYV